MGVNDINAERMLRFHLLYSRVFQEKFDREEFEADDLYAFQAFERALKSTNQELRNLAAHLQAQRQDAIEAITLTPMEVLQRTRRMAILSTELQSGELPVVSDEPPPLPDESPPAPAEEPAGDAPLSPLAVRQIASLQRLYLAEFSRSLDMQKFVADDDYGLTVLKESLRASSPGLVDAAKTYLAGRRPVRAQGDEGGAAAAEAPKAGEAP